MRVLLEMLKSSFELVNIDIKDTQKDIRALNRKDPVMEKCTINGQKYRRPTETKIEGIPLPGEGLKSSSVLLGGDRDELTYEWKMADEKDGTFSSVGNKRLIISRKMPSENTLGLQPQIKKEILRNLENTLKCRSYSGSGC